jgi:hypothetical protein
MGKQEYFIVLWKYKEDEPLGIFSNLVDARRMCYKLLLNKSEYDNYFIKKVTMVDGKKESIEKIYLGIINREIPDGLELSKLDATQINKVIDYLIKLDEYDNKIEVEKQVFVNNFKKNNPPPAFEINSMPI